MIATLTRLGLGDDRRFVALMIAVSLALLVAIRREERE